MSEGVDRGRWVFASWGLWVVGVVGLVGMAGVVRVMWCLDAWALGIGGV